MIIHRAALNGKTACGSDHGRISASGAVVNCPDCIKATRPMTQDEVAAYYEKLAEQRRALAGAR